MRALILLLTLLLTLSVTSVFAQNASRDLQSWNDFQVTIPVDRGANDRKVKTYVSLFGTLRFGRDLTQLSDQRGGISLDLRLRPYLSVSPGILVRRSYQANGRSESETRLRTDVSLEKSIGRIALRDRNRLEYRIRSGGRKNFRYRYRIQLSTPVTRGGKELVSPYLAYEFFADLSAGEWSRNEFSVGLGRKVSDIASVDFYYLFQQNRSGSPRLINVIGMNWRVRLK